MSFKSQRVLLYGYLSRHEEGHSALRPVILGAHDDGQPIWDTCLHSCAPPAQPALWPTLTDFTCKEAQWQTGKLPAGGRRPVWKSGSIAWICDCSSASRGTLLLFKGPQSVQLSSSWVHYQRQRNQRKIFIVDFWVHDWKSDAGQQQVPCKRGALYEPGSVISPFCETVTSWGLTPCGMHQRTPVSSIRVFS